MKKMNLEHFIVPRNQRSAPRQMRPCQIDNGSKPEGAQFGTISTTKKITVINY